MEIRITVDEKGKMVIGAGEGVGMDMVEGVLLRAVAYVGRELVARRMVEAQGEEKVRVVLANGVLRRGGD